jgi:hypothetical protein
MRIALSFIVALVFALFVVPALAPSMAFADPSQDRVEAAERYKEGVAALRRGDNDAARLALLQAHALIPDDANILWNLAFAEYSAHRYLDAARHFRERLLMPGVTDKDRQQAEKFLGDTAKELGHIRITAAPEAWVALDGTRVQTWNESVDVEPGTHTVEAHLRLQTKTVTVSSTAGEMVAADLTFAVDEPTAPAPVAPASPPAPVARDLPNAPSSPPPPSDTARLVLAVSLGTVAIASGVIGAVLLASAGDDGDHAHSLMGSCLGGASSACAESHSDASDAADKKNLATGFFVGGGALVGAAVVSWFLLAPSPRATSAAWVAPQVSPTSAGAAVMGRF